MQLDTHRHDHTVVVNLAGDWRLGERDVHLGELVDDPTVRSVGFDVGRLGSWDSSLLAFLMEGLDYCDERGIEFRERDLPEDIVRLIALSRAVPEHDVQRDSESEFWLARLGNKGARLYDTGVDALRFVGETSMAFGRLVTGRSRYRWRDFWLTVQSTSSGALPIVTLIAFLIGLIISFLGAVVLERFAAGYYVSYLVSYGVLRELGALMTGIIMAGRTGAAFAAELGSMKITEELDAFRTLGIRPVDYLVLPRVLAVFLMLPLLTVYADFVAIFGGLIVAVGMLDLSVQQFLTGLLEPVVLGDALVGVFKGLMFGLIIGVSGCMQGMRTGNDAGAVGKAATSAVVTAITFIIIANALIDWVAAFLNV